MRAFKPMLAVFIYEGADGSRKEWTVGCVVPPDNEQTLLAHFKQWMPSKTIIRLTIEDESLTGETQ